MINLYVLVVHFCLLNESSVCVCWQLYPISPLPDDLHHDLIQTESLSAQDYGWRPALMALLQELSLYNTRKHQTKRLHAHKHTLTQHDTFADSPDHIIKPYFSPAMR